DYVQAHLWLNLAGSQFSASEKEKRDHAIKYRNLVTSKMTLAQIGEAQKLAREWSRSRNDREGPEQGVKQCEASIGRTSIALSRLASTSLWRQSSTTPVQAADYDVGSIHIAQPWSRATPKGAKAGAGYMAITNKGTTPDKVSCVSDDA